MFNQFSNELHDSIGWDACNRGKHMLYCQRILRMVI